MCGSIILTSTLFLFSADLSGDVKLENIHVEFQLEYENHGKSDVMESITDKNGIVFQTIVLDDAPVNIIEAQLVVLNAKKMTNDETTLVVCVKPPPHCTEEDRKSLPFRFPVRHMKSENQVLYLVVSVTTEATEVISTHCLLYFILEYLTKPTFATPYL